MEHSHVFGYISSSEDDDLSLNEHSFDYSSEASLDSEDEERQPPARTASDCGLRSESQAQPINITQQIINREHNVFSGKSQQYCAFNKVPNRLGFCIKDIVPRCFLQGHMFMGLSFCGQFLLSYKVSCNDSVAANHYSFNIGYVYTLYFWEYQPHKPLRNFYKCCLFDDHGVDNLKQVTMTQWKCTDPRILIVHGAAEDENEDSYITYVKVPKLGCFDCKKLREEEDEPFRSSLTLCLKCNLTIHTKYASTESDQKFSPHINLICPDRILIVSNGFMHMLRIDIKIPQPLPDINYINNDNSNNNTYNTYNNNNNNNSNTFTLSQAVLCPPPHEVERRIMHQHALPTEEVRIGCDNHNNIVARIIADFSDFESSSSDNNQPNNNYHKINNSSTSSTSCGKNNDNHRCVAQQNNEGNIKTYDELIFTCNGSNSNNNTLAANVGMSSANTNSSSNNVAKSSLITHRGQRRHRIVTKSYRNGVNTVDTSLLSSSAADSSNGIASSFADKSNTYEFSEDNEKCEKISTLRKRRLADKKYEFSEDNSENIVPFTKLRSTGTRAVSTLPMVAALFNTVPVNGGFSNSPCSSPSSSPLPSVSSACSTRHCTPPPFSALQLGYCSPPCNSPVSSLVNGSNSSIMRSPNFQSSPSHSAASGSPIPKAPLSALQVSMAKRNHIEFNGSMSPNGNIIFLSPRREENRVVEVPLHDCLMPEKPLCTKKLKRRYVENDDAASVITSEEDDCISPGYHTSLPMEVHGSCYSELQMISQASYQQLRCTSVVITQHSFDLETFTYYVISTLCQKNNKTYNVFYDWACELISVCPLSHTIMCLLMAQFSARDHLTTNCINCSRKLSCVFHRKQFECRILFTWNMETGVWEVLDYGELHECIFPDLVSPLKRRAGRAPITLVQRAKKLASELAGTLNKVQDYSRNLRVLDSNLKKSKTILSDLDNMIEFHKKRHHTID